jgi:hypothetical protein
MATSTRETATDRLFDYLIERQASLFDGVRANTDRYHRFNRSVIEGVRQSSLDWTDVGRRWLANPADLIGMYEAASEALGNSQQRALALGREWLDDRIEVQRENREALRRGLGDVRQVVERAQANAPEFLRRGFRRRANGREEPATTEA